MSTNQVAPSQQFATIWLAELKPVDQTVLEGGHMSLSIAEAIAR